MLKNIFAAALLAVFCSTANAGNPPAKPIKMDEVGLARIACSTQPSINHRQLRRAAVVINEKIQRKEALDDGRSNRNRHNADVRFEQRLYEALKGKTPKICGKEDSEEDIFFLAYQVLILNE